MSQSARQALADPNMMPVIDALASRRVKMARRGRDQMSFRANALPR
jgi:hypothetical protein